MTFDWCSVKSQRSSLFLNAFQECSPERAFFCCQIMGDKRFTSVSGEGIIDEKRSLRPDRRRDHMARSSFQKMKILYVMQYLLQYSDENHPRSIAEIIAALDGHGIAAE